MNRLQGLRFLLAVTVALWAAAPAAAQETAALLSGARVFEGDRAAPKAAVNGAALPCGDAGNDDTVADIEYGWAYLGGGSTQTLLEDGTTARRLRKPPRDYVEIVADLAAGYALDPRLVIAVMAVESGFHRRAVSPKGAQGLMQLIPATANRFGVADPFDPRQNIKGGMKYLRWLFDHFNGNLPYVLAAYNAGENAVLAHDGIPPYDETRDYVLRVLRLYDGIVAFGAGTTGPVPLWGPAPWMMGAANGDSSTIC